MGETTRATHPAMPAHRWIFPGSALRVLDGDTADLLLDLGFGMRLSQTPDKRNRFRLHGVDTPETNRAETRGAGLAAKAYTTVWLNDAALLHPEWPLVVEVLGFDNFGRVLCTIWRKRDGRCLNTDLIEAGHAAAYRAEAIGGE